MIGSGDGRGIISVWLYQTLNGQPSKRTELPAGSSVLEGRTHLLAPCVLPSTTTRGWQRASALMTPTGGTRPVLGSKKHPGGMAKRSPRTKGYGSPGMVG